MILSHAAAKNSSKLQVKSTGCFNADVTQICWSVSKKLFYSKNKFFLLLTLPWKSTTSANPLNKNSTNQPSKTEPPLTHIIYTAALGIGSVEQGCKVVKYFTLSPWYDIKQPQHPLLREKEKKFPALDYHDPWFKKNGYCPFRGELIPQRISRAVPKILID